MTARRDLVHPPALLVLKVAARALVRAVGGTDAAGEALACRHQRMSDVGLPNTPDFIRVDEIAALEDLTAGQPGWPHVTRALAKRQGFTLLALPDLGALPAELHASLGEMAREVGEVTQSICAALADGEGIDAKEEAEIKQQIGEAIERLVQLGASVSASVIRAPRAKRGR